MAFKRFKRKKEFQENSFKQLITLPPTEYARFVGEFVDGMDPGTRTHVAVAYQNLIPFLSAIHSHAKQRGEEYSVEKFIEGASSRIPELENDEINSRRNSWFLFAAMIARLEKLAKADSALVPFGATVWTILVTEYPRIKVVLPNNVVWKDEEKVWFDLDRSDQQAMQDAINLHVPPIFANDNVMANFARSLNVLYNPSRTRVGYVP